MANSSINDRTTMTTWKHTEQAGLSWVKPRSLQELRNGLSRSHIMARTLVCWYAYQHLDMGVTEIAPMLGKPTHSGVSQAISRALTIDAEKREQFKKLVSDCQSLDES